MVGAKVSSKRSAIIATARTLFEAQSFEKTTMEEIARGVPVSKGTLYAEFSKKEDIMLEICREHCIQILEMMETTAANSENDHIGNLKQALMKHVLYVVENAQTVRTPESLVYVSDKVHSELSDYFVNQQTQVMKLLQKALDAKEISADVDVVQLSATIMTVMSAYLPPYRRLHQREKRPTKKILEKDFRLFLDLFFNGLKSQS